MAGNGLKRLNVRDDGSVSLGLLSLPLCVLSVLVGACLRDLIRWVVVVHGRYLPVIRECWLHRWRSYRTSRLTLLVYRQRLVLRLTVLVWCRCLPS